MDHLFNSKIDIKRIARTSDSMGGWTEAKTIIYRNQPCRINWKSGSERIQFDKNTYYRDGTIYCRVINITVRDLVVFNTVEYEIMDTANVDEVGKYMTINIRLIQ